MSIIDPAYVDAPFREPVTYLLVWLNGDDQDPVDFTHLMTSWSANRTPEDSPESASQFLGTIASQATVTLEWNGDSIPGGDGLTKSRDLSPYVGSLTEFRDAAFGVGLKVQLLTGFENALDLDYIPGTGWEEVAVAPMSVFVGRIDSVSFTDGATATLSCLDFAQTLNGTVDLPVCATTGAGMPLVTIAEFLLRQGGYYRTPPPLSGCILSVPAILPEIGAPGAPLNCSGLLNSTRHYRRSAATNTYIATDTYAPTAGSTTVIEGWWVLPSTGGSAVPLIAVGSDQAVGGIRVTLNSNRSLTIDTMDGATPITTAASTIPTGTTARYLFIELQHSTSSTAWFVQVDSTTQSGTGPRFLPADNLSPLTTIRGGYEGVTLRLVPTGYTREVRNTWTPNYSRDITAPTSQLSTVTAIPRGQTGRAWQLLRDMTASAGAWCLFDDAGTFVWREYGERVRSRFVGNIEDLSGPIDDEFKLIASGFSYNAASMRSEVTADWTEYEVIRSTVAEPLWSATEPLTFPANTITTLYVDTDEPLASILPARKVSTTHVDYSSVQFVPESQVGDPAATVINELEVRIVPTAAGFAITVRNSRSVPVATWDPGTSAPFVHLQGWRLTSPGTHAYTAKASSRTFEPLVLPPTTWRQHRATAVELADTIASFVALPQMVFAEQIIISDPNLRIGQAVPLQCWAVMDEPIACQIVGINYGETEYGITVLPVLPPTGWILAENSWEADRSVLDTDITLSA